MSRFQLLLRAKRFSLEESAAPVDLDPGLAARVDALWEEEQVERAGSLFDAPIFSLQEQSGSTLRGHFAPYRWWIAQLRDPTLVEVLRVQPVAVCGLLTVEEGIIFGLRSQRTFQDPGRWEPAPAGGIEPTARDSEGRLSPERQLLQELSEELHLPSDAVEVLDSIGLVRDSQTGVHDIAYDLRATLSLSEVVGRFEQGEHSEYSEIRWVAKGDLKEFVEDESTRVAPITRVLIEARGWV